MKTTREIQKPDLAATASGVCPSHKGGQFSSEAPQRAIKSLLRALPRLRTMDGLAPGSQFSWWEVSDA